MDFSLIQEWYLAAAGTQHHRPRSNMPTYNTRQSRQRDLADSIIRLAPLDEIRILLACGAKVNEPVTRGLRPIHYAAYYQYTEAVNLLLVRGCDPNLMDDVGYTALHLCAERGYLDLLRLFVKNKARVCFTDIRPEDNPQGCPPRATIADEPLRLAIKNGHYDCSKFLLESGANPNAEYFLGSEINLINPLNLIFLELLLKYGANPNARDRSGLTPLMKACRHPEGIEAAYLLIIYGADVNAMTAERHDRKTVLHYAVFSGNLDIVKMIVSYGGCVRFPRDYLKPTPLDYAIFRGDYSIAKYLIEAGADVNAGSPIIGSPLHIALSEKLENKYELLELLLQHGADPNAFIFGSDEAPMLRPPLGEYLHSTEMPSSRIILLLLKYGAKVIFKSQQQNPLGILNCVHKIHLGANLKIFELLFEACDEFSLWAIERSTILSEEHKEVILEYLKTPSSLKNLCRRLIRKKLQPLHKIHEIINLLPIPKVVKNFVSYNYS